MSKYALKNLMEIDPVGEGAGVELRFSRKYLDSRQLGVSLERIAPNVTATGGHHHDVQEEAYVVIEGSGAIKLDDERIELQQWDVVRVSPEVVRGFDAGPDGLVLIAVGGEKPEGGDGHMIADRWPAS
ncbi:MAG: cupin domain-containing protein [Actinobacteria bacterium]|nr:cupin domain-containing protein [Actinomycetota bacterium]